jgi:hypothetical protein
MIHQNNHSQALDLKDRKRTYYITEILMLKSIIILLVLTFFLINEMQTSI